MLHCDLNCDMGEGTGNDAAIMPFITSANIACGYHAGDEHTMRQTILLCQKNNVAIGAHPSYDDKENFGRKEVEISPSEVYQLVLKQVLELKRIADAFKARVHHVKPHGALYNAAAREPEIASAIARAVKDTDKELILYGLSGSCLISEGISQGLKTASEVFADRTYQNDGSLTSRALPNAMIEDENKAVYQVLQMVTKGSVISVTGKEIPIIPHSVCIHGDGKHAAAFAKHIYRTLQQHSIAISTI
jgi:UPF0271 protein